MISVFSRIRASFSVSVTMKATSSTRDRRKGTMKRESVRAKYARTRARRFLALPA